MTDSPKLPASMTDNITVVGDSIVDQPLPRDWKPDWIQCQVCERYRPPITITPEGCDLCFLEADRETHTEHKIGWPEIRHRRNMIIREYDWTQLPDAPQAVRDRVRALRQQLRDITASKPTPKEAWEFLDYLETELAK